MKTIWIVDLESLLTQQPSNNKYKNTRQRANWSLGLTIANLEYQPIFFLLLISEKRYFLHSDNKSGNSNKDFSVSEFCMLKKALSFLVIFPFLFLNTSFSQDNLDLKKYLPPNIDPLDLNLLETKKVLDKKIDVNEKKFAEGYIIQSKDTIKCQIYTERSIYRPSLFLVIKIADSLYVLTPYQVKEFMISGKRYIRHSSNTNNFKNLFFMKEMDKGRINLYGKSGIPSDPGFIFYISNDNNRTFYMINPYTRTVAINEEKSYRDTKLKGYQENIMYYNTNNTSGQFIDAIMKFVGDCTIIRNKIKQEWYTITDIEKIIKDYNKCPL